MDVVAQVRAGVDERIAHAGLRREVRNMREASVAQQRKRRDGVGEIERIAMHARGREPIDAGALERDVVIRIEAVDSGDIGAVTLEAQCQMHADEPGRTRNEHTRARRHRARSACSSARSLAYLQKLEKLPMAMCT